MQLDEAKALLEAIKANHHYTLSAWEDDFMVSIENQLSLKARPSLRQGKMLSEIYRRCYGDVS